MWIGSFVCFSFKKELLEGKHNFLTNTFKLALYTDQANLSPELAGYETQGEVAALGGYATGGKPITIYPPTLIGDVAVVEFDDVTWADSTITARGALVYNATAIGWPSVFVLDFGAQRISNAGNFTVRFPGPDPSSAVLRVI